MSKLKQNGPKVLFLDIETAPIVAHTWDVWNVNIGYNQIVKDWSVLSWSAKWLDGTDNNVMYMDNRNSKNVRNDKKLIKAIWKLLDEADIIITQNGKRFDEKKLNARFIYHELQPPGSYKHIDTRQIAKRKFGFTYNSLEYFCDYLNVKYKKLKHKKFPGQELWDACLAGNIEAWDEMEKYNKHDVLALKCVYEKLMPWSNNINFSLYNDEEKNVCHCGSSKFIKKGFHYSESGKFQRYKCKNCGAPSRSKKNLLSKEKRASLRPRTT